MTRVIQPPYQLIEFSGGGLNLGGYAQIASYLPPVTLLTSIGGLKLGGQGLALPPVSDRGGLRLGGRARAPILVGQYSPNIARFGTTAGMTVVVNSPNTQGSQYLPDIGFSFPLYGSTYRSNIAISSNWALLFGFNALASTDISHTVPGQAFLMAASLARSWDKVSVKADNSYSYRIRFESQIASGASPIFNVFEVTLYSDGSIQLVCGTNFDFYGSSSALRVRSLTKGDNVSYADFDRPYPYTPDSASASAGVDSSYVFTPNDNAANSHAVSVGSYLPLAYYPPISSGGLRLGGRSNPNVLAGYTYSSAIAILQSSTGMTQVVSAYGDDVGQYLPDIGFNFPIYGSTYRSNISVGSNWYLLFGAVSTAYSGLSRTVPGMGLLFGAADRSWQNVYFKAGSGFCQIRFEGHVSSSGTSYAAIFQIKLFLDGTIELTIGIGSFYNPLGITPIQTLTKGDGITYADFTVPAGSTAQTDFTSTAVLTSLVFSPVDVIGSSHTVQTGSYLSSASSGLLGAIAQPQVLAGALSVGSVSAGLNGAISQPQALSGSLSIGIALSAPINQPQSLIGSLIAVSALTGLVNQPQTIAGSLSIGSALIGGVTQSQNLAGALSVATALSASIIQPQSLTSNISVNAVISGAISQTQSTTGLLLVGKALVGGVSQPQFLTGSIIASSGLNAPIIQPQSLAGSLIIGNALIGSMTQPQSLAGSLIIGNALIGSVTQSQSLAGSVSVAALLSGITSQPQVLAGSLIVRAPLSASISQPQTLSGGLSVAVLLSINISQPQTLTGGLSVVIPLVSNVSQPQSLSGSMTVGKLLTSLVSQPQVLAGSLIASAPLSASISQPQALTGALLSSAPLAFSSTIATLQSSTGMTQVVSAYADDAGQYLPDIGFNFPIYGSTYRTNISIGSNWYLLFGLTSTAFSGLSRTSPGMGLLFGAADRSWRNVYFKAGSGFCQVRFEGQTTSSGASNTAIFQIKLFNDGTIELTIGIGSFYSSPAAISSLTKGDNITYVDFTVPAGSTAQTDFTSTAVLTSLVFRPVDVAGNSHTVATGSYS